MASQRSGDKTKLMLAESLRNLMRKKPLDKILAISNLKKDLLALGFVDKKLDWKLSVEFYHFVRGWNDDLYRVVAMKKDLYEYVMSNLDTRRKLSFLWMGRKKKVKLI